MRQLFLLQIFSVLMIMQQHAFPMNAQDGANLPDEVLSKHGEDDVQKMQLYYIPGKRPEDELAVFKTIDPVILEKMATTPLPQSFQSGQTQLLHVLTWARGENSQAAIVDELLELGKDPLGFKVHCPPTAFRKLLTDHCKSTTGKSIKLQSQNELTPDELWRLITDNIDRGSPILAYSQEELRILLTTVVGYQTIGKKRFVLILDHVGEDRRRIIQLDDFHTKIDMSDWIIQARVIGILFRGQSLSSLIFGVLQEIENFNIFTFKKCENNAMEQCESSPIARPQDVAIKQSDNTSFLWGVFSFVIAKIP